MISNFLHVIKPDNKKYLYKKSNFYKYLDVFKNL